MSLTENFLSTAKQLLLATENLKHMEAKLSRLSDDVAGINHRLVRVEALIEYSKAGSQATVQPSTMRRRRIAPAHED